MIPLAAISTLQLISVILVLLLLFLGFKIVETNWSYRIGKPHQWETAVEVGLVSKKLRRIERFYRDKVRFYTFWFQIERLKRESIAGAFAEVGVYRGETAKMIHAMDPSRTFHLFDTFAGFDERDINNEHTTEHTTIDFSNTSVDDVKLLIDGGDKIIIHRGYFPETTKNLEEQTYSFVHLDADLYQPTLAALKYFYPRLSSGGVIIIHDYNHKWEGVRRALGEVMPSISETLVEIADAEGSVMIVKNNVES